jgi:uncharacterized protein (DUF433 family)
VRNLPDFLTEEPDGEVHLTGRRMGLYTVVRRYREGLSAERIAEEYPTLPLALVYKVLAFYLENQAEVDEYVASYRAELERQEAAFVPTPAQLEIRRLMAERLRPDDSGPQGSF